VAIFDRKTLAIQAPSQNDPAIVLKVSDTGSQTTPLIAVEDPVTGVRRDATAPSPPWQSGRYYTPIWGSTGTQLLTSNQLRLACFYVPNQVTLSRIGAEITLAGEAGAVLRLGIYADDGTGQPGALVVDAGTVPADVAAVVETVINVTLNPGFYWVGGVPQSCPTTAPTVRASLSGAITANIAIGTATPGAGAASVGISKSGVSGVLPTPCGAISWGSGNNTRCFVKVA